jgi:hypothetical protein
MGECLTVHRAPQESCQRRHVSPRLIETEANSLNLGSNLRMSLHQKDPFIV